MPQSKEPVHPGPDYADNAGTGKFWENMSVPPTKVVQIGELKLVDMDDDTDVFSAHSLGSVPEISG